MLEKTDRLIYNSPVGEVGQEYRGRADRRISEKVPFFMKPVLSRTVQVLQVVVLAAILASIGLLLGEKGLSQKRKLVEKRAHLEREHQNLVIDITSLERKVTLLRTDPATLEKSAKCKLGMARRDETVYLFTSGNQSQGRGGRQSSLTNRSNKP